MFGYAAFKDKILEAKEGGDEESKEKHINQNPKHYDKVAEEMIQGMQKEWLNEGAPGEPEFCARDFFNLIPNAKGLKLAKDYRAIKNLIGHPDWPFWTTINDISRETPRICTVSLSKESRDLTTYIDSAYRLWA